MALGISAGTWLGAGAAVGGALISSSGAKSAANTQANSANNATAMQQQMFNTTQANLKPWMDAGSSSLNKLKGYIDDGTLGGKFTNADLNANLAPNYAFQLKQGQQALQNSQAAGDGVLSGSAMKGLINFNQNSAASAYQQAYENWLSTQNNTYNQLSGIAGLGENAAANLGNNGTAISNGMANTITGAGNARAAGAIGSANAITGAINNGMGYYQMNNLINKMSPDTSNTINA